MQRTALTLFLLSLGFTAGAQRADPLQSPECGQAVQALEQARAEPHARGRVEPLRKQAAQACLGSNGHTRAPLRAPSPPLAVAPPAFAPAPAPLAVPPPAAAPRPAVTTACDAAGCWDSNGNRLNRAGPVLLGPQGVCTQVAGVLSCP